MHASYYCALLYCVSEIFHFLQVKDLWQPSIGQVYQCYVSNGICSLCVSVSHFGNTIFQTASWSLKVKVKSLRHVWLFVIPWTVAYHTPPSMGFSRQEYWSGLPFPPPEDLPDPGIEPASPALWADVLPSEPPGESHDPSRMAIYSHWSLMLLLQKDFDLLKIQMRASIYY